MHDPITVDVARAARLVGVSRAALYPLVMSGDIPSFKVGRRRLVPVAGLEAWAARTARDEMERRAPGIRPMTGPEDRLRAREAH